MRDPEATLLVELRYFDQELAEAYRSTLDRFGGRGTPELRRFRADHQRHAQRIDDYLFDALGRQSLPMEAQEAVSERIWPVRDARDAESARLALLAAERYCLETHQRALRTAALTPAAEVLVREHLDEEQQHVRYLEQRALVSSSPASGGIPPELW